MSKKITRRPFKLAAERESEDSVSHEIFTEVGRTIVQLSNIENELANLYHRFANAHYDNIPAAMAVFFSQSWLDGKVMLVDLLFLIDAPEEFIERWKKIIKELKQHRDVRSLVAHQRLYVSYPDKEGRVNAWLDPAELNLKFDYKTKKFRPAKGRSLQLREVRSTASALDRISKEFSQLWYDLEEHDFPEHLRSDYADPEDE